MADQYVDTAAGSLRYRIDGVADGPALLLSNSLGTTLELWDGQVERWSRRYRLIRYDMRGHGKSSVPPGEYTIDDLGRDAIAVLDAAGVRSAHVCGISIGGLTAQWLGVNAPERVDALVIANSAAKLGTLERWTERIAKVRNEGMTAIADVAMGTWFTEEYRRREPAAVERFHRMVAGCSPDGYVGCCAALRDGDLRHAIHNIRARTLVIAGELDKATPPAESEEVRHSIPGASLVTLPCAHISNVECVDAFSQHADTFLTSQAGHSHVGR